MTIQSRKVDKPLKTYSDLLEAVESRRDAYNVEMGLLRDIHGAGKLGIHVAKNISDELTRLGLGHYPEELPQHQYEMVRIYVRGSAMGKIIQSVLTVDSASNRFLRDLASNEDTQTIKRIRELVCE